MTFPVESKLPDEWVTGDSITDRGTEWVYHGAGLWKATMQEGRETLELEIRWIDRRDVGELHINGQYRCTLVSRRISTMVYEARKVLPKQRE